MRNASPIRSVAIFAVVVVALVAAIAVTATVLAVSQTQDGRDLLKMIGTAVPSVALIAAIAWATRKGMRA